MGKEEQGQLGGEGAGLEGSKQHLFNQLPKPGSYYSAISSVLLAQLSDELIPSVIPVKPTVLHLGLTQLNNTRVTF